NLILLCGTHHDTVDVLPNDYTVADLRQWKQDHEEWVRNTLSDAVVAVTFKELDQICDALVATVPTPVADITPPTAPAEKMRVNSLTVAIAHYYQLGQLRFFDVESFLASAAAYDPDYGD